MKICIGRLYDYRSCDLYITKISFDGYLNAVIENIKISLPLVDAGPQAALVSLSLSMDKEF